jgi:prolyl-tRNA synthetase
VQNCYFPLFVSERALKAEASHIEGFAPEVLIFAKKLIF